MDHTEGGAVGVGVGRVTGEAIAIGVVGRIEGDVVGLGVICIEGCTVGVGVSCIGLGEAGEDKGVKA